MLYVHAHCSTLHNAHILAKISNTKSFLVCVCFPFVFSVTETMLIMCVSDRELVSYSSHVPICTYVWEAASFSPITTSVPSPDQIFSPPMFSTLKFFFFYLSLMFVSSYLSSWDSSWDPQSEKQWTFSVGPITALIAAKIASLCDQFQRLSACF